MPIPIVLAFGVIAEASGDSALGALLSPVVQLGALGLLAVYLFWGVRERREEREARVAGEKAERDARLAEIQAIASSHKEQLTATIEAMQRAYENRKPT